MKLKELLIKLGINLSLKKRDSKLVTMDGVVNVHQTKCTQCGF